MRCRRGCNPTCQAGPDEAPTMRPPVLKLLSFRVQSDGARPTRAQPMGKCVGSQVGMSDDHSQAKPECPIRSK
jgi:hypothetical protein